MAAADRPIPGNHAAHGRGLRRLSRRGRPSGGRHGGRADRAAGQRRRGHDVHVVAMHQRRHVYAHRHLQAGSRSQYCPGAGAEPRRRRPAAAAGPGRPQGHHGEEEIASSVDDRQSLLARQEPRQPLSQQLCHDPDSRRADPLAGRGRRHLPRPARLQHEALARSGQDAPRRPLGGRRGGGHPAAERPSGRRPDRPAARCPTGRSSSTP